MCWTATRRSATPCACSISRAARSCGRSPTRRRGSFMFAGSRTTPTVDGEHVYTVGPDGRPARDQHEDAEARLAQEHLEGLRRRRRAAALGDRPEPVDLRRSADRRAADVGGRRRRLRQADAATLKWKSPALSGIPGYVTPSIVKVAGEDQLVMITGAAGRGRTAKGGSVNGLDPRSGKVLWTYADCQCIIPVPQAVDAGEGRVLVTGAYGAGTVMLKVEKKGDGTYAVVRAVQEPGLRRAHPAAGPARRALLLALHDQRAQRRPRRDGHGRPGQVEDRSEAAVRARRLDSRRRPDADDRRQHQAVSRSSRAPPDSSRWRAP